MTVGQIAGYILLFALVGFILTSLAIVFGYEDEEYVPLPDNEWMKKWIECFEIKGYWNTTDDTCQWIGDPV